MGLNWRDQRDMALRWLADLGDPYVATAYDEDGRVGIDWGVYGAPETFLVDADGTVLYKHISPMTEQVWQDEFVPRIEAARSSGAMRIVCALLLMCSASLVFAIDTEVAFEDPEMQARYQELIDEVRCMICQNQTIKDSSTFLAADLRREIRRLMSEGNSDREIADFLVARYGESVLYRPRMRGATLVLWLAPLILIGVGGFAIARIIAKRASLPIDEDVDQVAS